MSAPVQECPVCLRDARDEAACPGCGWTLRGDRVLGHPTPEQERGFAAALAAARREVDLRAALLAAGYPGHGDPGLLGRLRGFARGGPTAGLPVEALTVEDPAGEDPVTHGEDDVRAAAATALDRLTGDHDRLTAVELTPEGVRAAVFTAGEVCAGLRGPVTGRSWRDLLPALPADDDLRRFRLAGGIGDTRPDPALLAAQADAAAPATDGPVLLLVRVPGWALPERVAARLRERGPSTELRLPPTGRTLTDDGVAALLALAPLRRDVGLVVADTGPGGRVRTAVRRVFPAGTTAAAAEPVTLAVRTPAVASAEFTLAVVAAAADDDPARWRPLAVTRARLRPAEEHRVDFTLAAGARVGVRCADDVTARHVPAAGLDAEWAATRAAVPETYRPADVPGADLAFAVELGGARDAVRERLALVAETVALVDAEHHAPASVRYAVLAYLDHSATRTDPGHVVRAFPLGAAADCLEFLGTLTPANPVYSHAAPVEDALLLAVRLAWRRTGAHRALVVLGSRPPHPTEDLGASAPRCPRRVGEGAQLRALRDLGVRLVGVWDRPDWTRPDHNDRFGRRGRAFWNRFGDRGLLDHRTTTAPDLVRGLDVRARAPEPHPLLLPLGGTR
ncbi:hypothetical protein [Saccharothrix xinjiangensis]|uniref:Uncharacterized protein n=1 Tax=Saccharothrix xinjiangensis TaxID=204798 RepID=A0ABV9Y944_9PSEU